MHIFRRKGSPYWWYGFSVRGCRFRGSTQTDDRTTADQIASKLRTDELLRVTTGKRPSLTLDDALGQWWLQAGQHHRAHRRSEGIGKSLLRLLGKAILLENIDDALIANAVARRRAQVSGSTVNVRSRCCVLY
jgi:hypothetical protein